ncbi:helix-hairpin-helix domain-containing protein [Cellulomonas fimi]|uniref:ComEA family DNA-binding protein n=1 Tax=Cellulomonas fimi TaxID=1708 RepID=UPI00234D1432|nr:helix-hairpin-helix domain-containing protein [Cellulomonas fimi]MDC7121032.1 helix-hairpin-helix domain-containing protein [Cellulomonas fimi]
MSERSATSHGAPSRARWPGDLLPPDPIGDRWTGPSGPPGRLPRWDAHPTSHAAPESDGPPIAAPGWDADEALRRVRDGYRASHGPSPLDRADGQDLDEDVAPHASRDAEPVRWLVSWRVAAAAVVVVILAAGTIAIRASTRATGAVVEIPVPGALTAPADADGDGVAGPTGGTPAAATGAPTVGAVVVHVVGGVVAPGVVRLPDGARVADALAAAGGPTADADLSTVNLARVVVDGEQVVVLRVGERPPVASTTGAAPGGGAVGPGAAAGAAGPVDLNTADVAALDALPGIGPVLAQRIVEHRTERPFSAVDELADVRGIGPALLENLRPLVRV